MALTLVTGSTGRIGKHMVASLIASGKRVRALTRTAGSRKLPGVEMYLGDMRDAGSVKGVMRDVETVYHLAANVDFTSNWKDMYAANVTGTKNLIELALESEVKRFVFASSIAAMGKKLSHIPADESEPCRPGDPYGKSKLEAEQLLLKAHEENGLPVSIVRPAMVYGRDFFEGYLYVMSGLESGKMPILGSGQNHIHFVHVSDLIQGLRLAADKKKAVGEVYIIADREAKTQEWLLNTTAAALGVEPPKRHMPVALVKTLTFFHEKKAGLMKVKPKIVREHIDQLAMDRAFSIDKARKELGYEPKIDIGSGIREMVLWYKSMKRQKESS